MVLPVASAIASRKNKRASEPKMADPDQEFKWALVNLKNSIDKVAKKLK